MGVVRSRAAALLSAVALSGCIMVSERVVADPTAPMAAMPDRVVAPPADARATPMPPITIYHLEGRRSERVIWLMEELGFPYDLKFVNNNLGASIMEIRKVNPGMPTAPTVI